MKFRIATVSNKTNFENFKEKITQVKKYDEFKYKDERYLLTYEPDNFYNKFVIKLNKYNKNNEEYELFETIDIVYCENKNINECLKFTKEKINIWIKNNLRG